MINVRALGPLEVTVDGNPAPADLLWRHNIALLLYLARAPARRCTRDQAIGLLWPDKPQEAARQSLREALRVLRRYLGDAHLQTEADQLQLAADAIELDTERFDDLIAKREWAAATPLVRGKFADGFGLDGSSAFEDWLHAEQWHWYSREMDVLIQHAEQRLDAGDLLGADEPTRRAASLDPESQRALRTRMRRLALAGDRSAALEQYEHFERQAKQAGPAIEPESQLLAERLRHARVWKLPPAAHAPDQGAAWRRIPLFGRGRALAQILEHWHATRSKRVSLVVIEAAPGCGKTRLAEEVMARATLDGGFCVATRAVPADRERDGGGILALVNGGLLEAPGVAASPPAALAAIAREAAEWAERFPGAARAPTAKPLGEALIAVVKSVSAEQPVLLVLDDAQWLDEASLAVIETMLRDLANAPVLILLATTLEPAAPKLVELCAAIERHTPGAIVRLPLFDPPALQALVRWAFHKYSDEQVDRLARRIAADSAGIPLLAVEICHAIAQGLDVNATSGVWPRPMETLEQTRPGDLPDVIVGAIRVAFNALSPAAGAALKAVAVLGDRVSPEHIGRASHLAGPALDAALDELEWRRWLVADARGYSFVARIVREVVDRDMVLPGERQRILDA